MRLVQQAYGAQILLAECKNGTPIFYLSPIEIEGTPRRGGVPVLFPQFADHGSLIKHGIARNLLWNLVYQDKNSVRIKSFYSLIISPENYPEWPHYAILNLVTEVQATYITITLEVENAGKKPFLWTGGLHPYFYVEDLLNIKIQGLRGVSAADRYDGFLPIDEKEFVEFSPSPFERLYQTSADLKFLTTTNTLKISSEGFSEWMIWNPGMADSRIQDLPEDDWRHFICIEPAIVSQPIKLSRNERFSGSLKISREDLKE